MTKLPEGFELIDDTAGQELPSGFSLVEDADIQPQEQYQEPQPLGRTMVEQGLQGLSFGWADEPINMAAAGILSATGQGNYKDLLNQATELTNQRLAAQQQQRPLASMGSQVLGGLATGGAIAGTKAGAAAGRMLGSNVFPQAKNLAARAANLIARSAKGGAVGAASGALYGAGAAKPDERAEGASQGAAIGGAVGAAIPVAGAALGSLASSVAPKIDEGLQDVVEMARQRGIPVSLDQATTSKPLKTLQKVSQELPLSGAGAFREQQLKQWNKNILKTVGQDADVFTPKVLDKAFSEVGKKFDDLGAGKTFTVGPEFKQRVDDIIQEAEQYATKDAVDNFSKALERFYLNVGKDGTISGEKLSKLRSEYNKLSRKASSADTKELLRDLENAVIDVMTAGDDAAKGMLSEAKQQYKNLLAIEPLTAKAKGGNISPTQLANRVSKIYGREYVRGRAGEIGDLARIGNELLGELGGSDTTQKALFSAGAMGGVMSAPATTAAVIGGNRATQKLLLQNQRLMDNMLRKAGRQAPKIEGGSIITPAVAAPIGQAGQTGNVDDFPMDALRITIPAPKVNN